MKSRQPLSEEFANIVRMYACIVRICYSYKFSVDASSLPTKILFNIIE